MTITVTHSGEGSCRFARRGTGMDFVEIRVSAASLTSCPAGSPVPHGIGNEAWRCKPTVSHGFVEEMVSGHVRAMHFTVVISTRGARRGGKPSQPEDDELTRIADEVAGNLY